MIDWRVLVLAALQGATEFLPVSSSGHLVLGGALFELEDSDLLLDVVLHGGTLGAVLAVYRHELLGIAKDCWGMLRGQGDSQGGGRLGGFILLASVPTALLGLGLKGLVEGVLRGPGAVGGLLLINGLILWSTREIAAKSLAQQPPQPDSDPTLAPKRRWDIEGLTWKRALTVGVVQGLAVVPGISRSGSTIAAALWLGVRSGDAARFSFLLSVPAVGGAVLLKLLELAGADRGSGQVAALVGGALVAGLVGWGCLRGLLKLLKKARFHQFAWYCWGIGAVTLGVWLMK